MRVMRNYFVAIATASLFFFLTPSLVAQTPSDSTIWRFDNIDFIGGHPTHMLGHPHLIESPFGNAIGFNGVDDALFVDVHPLAFGPMRTAPRRSGFFISRKLIRRPARTLTTACFLRFVS
jgi:hypothetical protein